MQTDVTIPDDVFEQAEKMADKLGISRSEFYTTALKEFLHRDEVITEMLNQVYADDDDSDLDPAIKKMQQLSLPVEQW